MTFLSLGARAQTDEIKIANEYYNNEEYDKARQAYEKISRKNEQLPVIYSNYLNTLIELKDHSEAEKLIKKLIKNHPDNIFYKADQYLLAVLQRGEEKSDKEFQAFVAEVKMNPTMTEKSADYLYKKGYHGKAREMFILSRKALNNNSLYAFPLAIVYKAERNINMMIEELLNHLKINSHELDHVRNTFQSYLSSEDFPLLETALYERIQKDPDEISYNELLLWLNIQQKNFGKAYMQARAIDKRNKNQGGKMIEVGRIAMDNKDYESAARFFQYVVTDHKTSYHYPLARRYLINAQEEAVKNTYPVEEEKIKALINEYQQLIKELGKTPSTMEALRNLALLYAFYLNDKDTAIAILSDAATQARFDERFKAKVKMDLGDIYLLKGEPWESTLLYSQVEKIMKEDPVGHDAKLRNAKLAYYRGDFELAQSHLDILKMATSREIANDAMELSLLITDNTGLDTSTEAMKAFAALDLLLFQNKNDEALKQSEALLKKFPGHSLTDEVYWLQSKIYRKTGRYDKALEALEKINTSYSNDILGDDALFTTALIYEENLKNKEKAMEMYKSFLLKYPGSIYTVEARKRFRLLRGDKL